MIELVFSFILSTWGGLGVVHEWADSRLGGARVLTERVHQEAQILCALERQGLLVYDGAWKQKSNLTVPDICVKNSSSRVSPTGSWEFRSESLASGPSQSSWDQRIDLKLPNKSMTTLFFRQDKSHIGVHSASGWSIWIERKTGEMRYELTDLGSSMHFRLKASVNLNPLLGQVSDVYSVEALYVRQQGGKIEQAFGLFGKKNEGYTQVIFRRENDDLKKILSVQAKRSFKDFSQDPRVSKISESHLNIFADINSKKYKDFLQRGLPLSFQSVNPEQAVPETSLFR